MLEVAFKNLTFGGKVEGRKLMSFGSGKPAYDVLQNALPGQDYTITVVKEGQYNNWTNAVQGTTASAASAATPASSPTPAPRSNFETPEERAQRQVYIIRQSSISSAISALSVGAKANPKVDEILSTAKQFEDYVFGRSAGKPAALGDDFFVNGGDKLDDIPM